MSWPVLASGQWYLGYAHEPILAFAAKGLSNLSMNHADGIIQLVVHRCSLHLLELQPGSGVVDYLGLYRVGPYVASELVYNRVDQRRSKNRRVVLGSEAWHRRKTVNSRHREEPGPICLGRFIAAA
jgi:hypothetical protein